MISRSAKGRTFANKYAWDDEDDSEEEKGASDPKKEAYVGKKEDDLWWEDVEIGDDTKQSQADIYRILVDNMGTFRWQNPQYALSKHCISDAIYHDNM